MPVIIQYLLKLSLSVAVIHAFYYLVLRRLTFYNLNRWYLSGYMLLCLVIPFINVAQIADKANEKLPALSYIPSVQNIKNYIPSTLIQTTQQSWNIWDVIIALLTVGSAIMLIKLIIQLASFIRMKQKAEVLSDNGAVIYHVDEQIMPFSFGDSIYLNKNSHTAKELEEIIMHEYVHVKQRHSVDILIAELFCIVNWYNPFAWFMRHSIRQNLEFIADDNVVRSGINKKDYQYHLLKVVGIPQYRIANQFNFSSLKKRIIMMNQQKSAKIHLLKFMFILPLLAVTLMAFRSEIANAIVKVKHMPITIKFINNANTLLSKPVQAAVTNARQITENPQITDDGQMKFTSLDSAVVDNVKQFITLYGQAKLSNATGGIEAPVIMADKNKDNGVIDFKNALVELDGKRINIGAIDLNKIISVNVLRSKTAITQFGEQGKYGVLLYSTRQLSDGLVSAVKTSENMATISALSAGEVITARKTKGVYTLIVKHDGDMFDVYRNLISINAHEGDKIHKASLIGSFNLDVKGENAFAYDLYKGTDCIGGYCAIIKINDTTKTNTTTTAKGNGTITSSSDTHSGDGLTYTGTAGSGSDNVLYSKTRSANGHGFTTATNLTYTASGSKDKVSAVTIYDADDLVFTIDPQHVDESTFGPMEKHFADNGFDLKISADVIHGKAKKLNISISSSQKDHSSSSVYTADDITDKDKILVRITANPKTGSVSINSTAESDDTK